MDYLEKTKEILEDFLGINKNDVTLESHLVEDFGCDSLDTVEITMAFEEEYNIDISDEEAEACRTVADIVKLLEAKTAK